MTKRVIATIAMVSMVFCNPGQVAIDTSPNDPTLAGGPSPAGVTMWLAGDAQDLFAVSMNAGVWKLGVPAPGPGAIPPWLQLGGGPPDVWSIAADPTSRHVAVGQRRGPARPMVLNERGAWESTDGGVSWTFALDPVTVGCDSEAVPAVSITHNGTLLVSTACGIFRRQGGTFQPASMCETPKSCRGAPILATAISASANMVWARTATGALWFSSDDGATFIAAPAPPSGAAQFTLRGTNTTLAGFDTFAFMMADAAAAKPPYPATCANSPPLGLLSFQLSATQPTTGTWFWQAVAQANGSDPACDKSANGGRIFMKAGATQDGDKIMSDLLVGNGQGVYAAAATSPTPVFTRILSTGAYGEPAAVDPNQGVAVHADLWDAQRDKASRTVWAASEGGVVVNHFDGTGWNPLVEGMHTNHVTTLSVMQAPAVVHLAYAAPDNDTWYFGDNQVWQSPAVFGDGGWTEADFANPAKVLLARSPFGSAALQSLDKGQGIVGKFALDTADQLNCGYFTRFVETTSNETVPPLDAVMMIFPPMTKAPPTAPSFMTTAGPPLIIRNSAWEAQPDFNSNVQSWGVETPPLPLNATHFFVSGGHTNTTYYAVAPDASQSLTFWGLRLRPGKLKIEEWVPLYTGLLTAQHVGAQTCPGVLAPSIHESFFVNPYDSQNFLLLTPSGVVVSRDGGQTIAGDAVLTALLTDSGSFPITRDYAPDAFWDAQSFVGEPGGSATHGTIQATLGDVSFSRANPAAALVSSPFTGVFFDAGDHIWRSLTPQLPTPFTEVSFVGLGPMGSDGIRTAYVGTSGRGILRVDFPGQAPIATYYVQPATRIVPNLGGQFADLAILTSADGTPVSGASVDVRILDSTHKLLDAVPAVTDTQGRVLIGFLRVADGNIVHLHFGGSTGLAESQTRFIYSSTPPT